MLTTNISEDMEQMEFLYNPGEIAKLYNLFDKNIYLAVSYTV